MRLSLAVKAAILSGLLLALFLSLWYLATLPNATAVVANDEYAAMLGKSAQKSSGLPTLAQMGEVTWKHLTHPFYDNGPNDKGIGIQLAYSLARVLSGFTLAALVAIPLGFVIGMSPLLHRALNPFIQVLKPISPLAWMPLAL